MEAAKCWCNSTVEAGRLDQGEDSTRHFYNSLIAAGSTLFLLIAANWQLGILSGIGQVEKVMSLQWCRGVWLRTVFSIMLSFFTLTLSFIDVYYVFWLWREDVFAGYTEGFISVAAIMGTCPILIAIPPSHWKDPKWIRSEANYERLAKTLGGTFTRKLDEALHPLPLSPRQQPATEVNGRAAAAEGTLARPTTTDHAHYIDHPAAALTPCTDTLNPEADHALSTPTTDTSPARRLQADDDAISYIVLSPMFVGRYSSTARRLLLKLKLVPNYQELSLLRSRSRFQNGVTFFQVAGYMMGVALRMAEGMRISPLEAILSLFCIQVLLQLGGALFVCSHYQRPLHLRLHPSQFSRLLQHAEGPPHFHLAIKGLLKYCIIFLGLVLTIFVLPAPLVYYALSIRHHCSLCFISTLFMAVLPLLSFLIMGALVWGCGGRVESTPRVLRVWPPKKSLGLPRLEKGGAAVCIGIIIIALLYVTGILLAGLASLWQWKLFRTQTSYAWIRWIWPHI